MAETSCVSWFGRNQSQPADMMCIEISMLDCNSLLAGVMATTLSSDETNATQYHFSPTKHEREILS